MTEQKAWKQALQSLSRVLKGWQEEAADAGTDRRSWRWLLGGRLDPSGYDLNGEKASILEVRPARPGSGRPRGAEGRNIDLNGFGVCVWGSQT